ncbi:hypothetical protein HK099_001171, partial [Clydaea vesicula]
MTINSNDYFNFGLIGEGKSKLLTSIDAQLVSSEKYIKKYCVNFCEKYQLDIISIENTPETDAAVFCANILSEADGVFIAYSATNSDTFLGVPELLDAFVEKDTPTYLISWYDKVRASKVDSELGSKLAYAFKADFEEIAIDDIEDIEREEKILQSKTNESIKNLFLNFIAKISAKRELERSRLLLLAKNGRLNEFKQQLLSVKKSSSTKPREHSVYPMPAIHASQTNPEEVKKNQNNNPDSPHQKNISDSHLHQTSQPTSPKSIQSSNFSADDNESKLLYNKVNDSNIIDINEHEPPLSRHFDIADIDNDGSGFKNILEEFSTNTNRDRGRLRQLKSGTLRSEISYEAPSFSDLQSPSINAGSFSTDDLIKRLTHETVHDVEFTKVFLMLYRKFMRPGQLLDRLMDRFDLFEGATPPQTLSTIRNVSVIHPCHLRVCNVLILWLTDYWVDFQSEKMRFTCQVFLETLSCRAPFTPIVHKLAGLIFRPPPSPLEVEAVNWGIPNSDEVDTSDSIKDEECLEFDDILQVNANNLSNQMMDLGVVIEHCDLDSDASVQSDSMPRRHSSNSAEEFLLLNSLSAGEKSSRSRTLSISSMDYPVPTNRVSFFSTLSNSGVASVSSKVSSAESINSPLSPDFSGVCGSSIISILEFMELSEEVIAQQLNLIEFEIFKKIQPRDMLHHIWNKKSKGRHASSVTASISHFNFISQWVATFVISQDKVKNRAKLLLKFMKIAVCLKSTNNYNTLMALLAGINSTALNRLKLTRKLLEDKTSFKSYLNLEKLMSSEKAFALYRAELKKSEMPCIPYLGVFLRDLLYIDESNKDIRPDGTVNLPKFLLIGDIILMIKSFQRRSHNIKKDPNVMKFIFGQPIMNED